jgi:cytochrome c553
MNVVLRRLAASVTEALVLLGLCSHALAENPGIAFFESKIRPVLIAECVECHGAEKAKGGLRLDSRAGWQKGGDSGAAVVPGKPAESLLLRSIRHEEPDLKMPDKAPKLEDAVLKDFERWIALGAPDPRDAPPVAGERAPWPDLLSVRRQWWALKPVPPLDSHVGLRESIDGHLQMMAAQQKLPVSGSASPETVVRRLHFGLNGLPPTVAEIDAFVQAWKRSPEIAVRGCAEALMKRSAFGEHFARRWMDLLRYADSHGSEGDPEIPGAYQYRDYLIRAFNADVPLNQLMVEHIAGDLLKQPRLSPEGYNESAIGPAHLRMVEHGYQPVDALDDRVKVVDNQIDVLTKAFQGFTVSCARCHDHKFDAVSQRDYTALYGILASARPAQIEVAVSEALKGQEEKLVGIKQGIRKALAERWLYETDGLEKRLRERLQPASVPELERARLELTQVEQELTRRAWARLGGSRAESPAPYALWNFARGTGDLFGRVKSELVGGARVQGGQLQLTGSKTYLRSEPLPVAVTEKTFEAWVSLDTLEQRGGGVVSLERIGTHGFDSLVFAEKEVGRWVAGSDFFKRSENSGGPLETGAVGGRIHVAVTYAGDGTVTLYRNGKVYGKSYRKGDLLRYEAGDGRLLVGLRHTGAGNGHFRGKVDEVRLYLRALSSGEMEASFRGGMLSGAPGNGTVASEDPKAADLEQRAAVLRKRVAELTPSVVEESLGKTVSSPEHPLHAVAKAVQQPERFAAFYPDYRTRGLERIAEARRFNAETFQLIQDLSLAETLFSKTGPDVARVAAGDFRVLPTGDRILDSVLPAGVASGVLTGHHGGAAGTVDFSLPEGGVSIRYRATGGAMARVVPSDYPLGLNAGAPRVSTERRDSGWLRMDTAYRAGVRGHIELSTPEYQMRRGDAKGAVESPGFVIERVVVNGGKETPRDENPALEMVLTGSSQSEPDRFLAEFRDRLKAVVRAWGDGTVDGAGAALIDGMVRSGMFTAVSGGDDALSVLVSEYRRIVQALPKARVVPGVAEIMGTDAPFLVRGDHKKPGEPVPRGYLEVLDPEPIRSKDSGRLELADRIVSAANPLTARVMANRLWIWIFGDGLVVTPDNFGKMGSKPEDLTLLDLVASRLQSEAWSTKRILLELVSTEAFRRDARAGEDARRRDPLNRTLSHATVRRLEAESIRDAMLKVAGVLDGAEQGPPAVGETRRRSIYLLQKRNNLPAFLTTFDAPKPFTTVGRRDVTTVPSQSLTLMNDPGVVRWAEQWAQRVISLESERQARLNLFFREGLGRLPTEMECREAFAFIPEGAGVREWTAIAHSVFNLKEFIYLR